MKLNRYFFCPLLCLFMPLFDPKHSYGNFSPSILFNTCTDVKEIKTQGFRGKDLSWQESNRGPLGRELTVPTGPPNK